MAFRRTIALILGGIALVLLTTGAMAQDGWPTAAAPANTTVLPVATATRQVGESISVCMYHGAHPQPYRVVAAVCRGGAEGCTAFVAVPNSEAAILTAGYDLTNPPVEATGPTCERPAFLPSGVPGSTRR